MQPVDRADGLRKLHEREDALLHARSARGRDADERDLPSGRTVAGAGELLADGAAHRAAHECEVHDSKLAGPALDSGGPGDDRVAEAGRHLRLGQAVRVGAEIEEVQRIGRAKARVLLDECATVGELGDPLARPHREMVPAMRADPQACSSSSSR